MWYNNDQHTREALLFVNDILASTSSSITYAGKAFRICYNRLSSNIHFMIKPTRGVLLVEDIKNADMFYTPAQNGEIRQARVLAVGSFLWHISHERIFPEPKVKDIVWFVFNGNEKIPGTNQYLIIFDQLRGIV